MMKTEIRVSIYYTLYIHVAHVKIDRSLMLALTLQIMMFQSRVLLGGGLDVYDQFRDWRLDVDNMSYEVFNFL